MMKSVENGTILNMDIAEIKRKVEDQLRVLIYIPYTYHENIPFFFKSQILTCLESKDVIGLAHPQVGIHEGKEWVGFNRALYGRLHDNTNINHFIRHEYLRNYTT